MSTRNKVLTYLKAIESGKYTISYVEQYLEEIEDLDTLEALQEIWNSPEIGDMT